VRADRVVALPRLRGVRIDGLPVNADGFVRTDGYGRVGELPDVYAAGDMTDSFPVKQGGIATQQADVVAEMIAADAGAPVTPRPFRPRLRGLLLTGDGERFLTADVAGGRATSEVDSDLGWWPPVKIPGRFLGPYLAGIDAGERLHTETTSP
jgi:sulfide:quinone oxidoreductase